MQTQRIIDNIRKVANQMDDILRSDLLNAASRLQEQSDLIERMQSELAQAISERTPHDYGILQDQRDEARGDAAHWRRIAEHRQKELSALLARPEPTRLEIAAIILTGSYSNYSSYDDLAKMGLKQADALIAAAKEVQ